MAMQFASVSAIQVLDSRGRPTVWVRAELADGREVCAGVPSGASSGSGEAVELRDHDPSRYAGLGVGQAVAHICGPIADMLTGRSFECLEQVDADLVGLDGTPNRSRLGSNAIVGVSMAAARAFAAASGQPLWRFLAAQGVAPRLPVPHFNVINGGAHARNPLEFQEFMIAPIGAPSLPEAIRAGAEIYSTLRGALTLIRSAAREGIANAALIKVNQVGTVTETLQALQVCRDAGYGAMISHRSGETGDTFIADLAVGAGCGQLKSGAPARGERVAKYNRLAEIVTDTPELAYGLPPRQPVA